MKKSKGKISSKVILIVGIIFILGSFGGFLEGESLEAFLILILGIFLVSFGIKKSKKGNSSNIEEKEKSRESNQESENPENHEFNAMYWGGHFLHPPVGTVGDKVKLRISKDRIIFEKKESFIDKQGWKEEIPLKEILSDEISQETGEDMAYKNKMTAMSYFAGQGPMTSYSRNITFLAIPYKDGKGKIQRPRFSFKRHPDLVEFSRLIHERI